MSDGLLARLSGDSGPWASRWTSDVSGLLHITRHHTDSKETL